MCGRFTLAAPDQKLREFFPLFDLPLPAARYNIAPTQMVAALRQPLGAAQPQAVFLRWGLIPSWAEDPAIGNRLINARAETLAEKPAFRSAFKSRRCLVLADGFYEWQKVGKVKKPFHIRFYDGRPFAFAGLWEHWDKGEAPIDSCTIITTAANDLVRPLHERMPVLLGPRDYQRWLDPTNQRTPELEELCAPFTTEDLVLVPANPRVNNVRNDDPECLAPP